MRKRFSDNSKTRNILLAVFALLSLVFFFKSYPVTTKISSQLSRAYVGDGGSRIAKVSMLYGEKNYIYERALRSHHWHNERFNYPFHVLRHEITGGYWNKPSYLLSLVVNELAKPPSERTEWLMWFDADIVLINPGVPLETFLPPYDFEHVHFVGNRDHAGLNTGTFFLRVDEWSVKFLAKAIAFPMFYPDIDLGVSADQRAMSHVLNETEFSAGVLYQPRVWYNTYEWHHAYEGVKGNLLVHFPGLGEDRWKHMTNWLNVVEADHTTWEVSLEKTMYLNETTAYWEAVRHAMETLRQGENIIGGRGGPDHVPLTFLAVLGHLKELIEREADNIANLNMANFITLQQMQELPPPEVTVVQQSEPPPQMPSPRIEDSSPSPPAPPDDAFPKSPPPETLPT